MDTAPQHKKYQNLILPVVSVLLGLALLGLVIVPQGLRIPETNVQIEQIRKSVSGLNLKIGQLNVINVSEYQQDLASSLVSLPDERDVPGALTLIFNLLRNNNLLLSGISFSNQDTEINGAKAFVIKIDVSGSKDSLTTLISQLKESPRVIKVDAVSTTTTTADSTSMQILVGLKTFYQEVPKSQALELEKPVELPTEKNRETLATIKDYYNRNQALIVEATASAGVLGKPDPFQ